MVAQVPRQLFGAVANQEIRCARSGCEVINQDRRQLLSTAAMGIAAAGAASFFLRIRRRLPR
jgi:hypothetical protein